jgi:hypothetical protein
MKTYEPPWRKPWASLPQLAAVVESDRESIRIRGAHAQVRIETDDRQPWLNLLARFDGRHALQTCLNTPDLDKEDIESLIERLSSGGLLLDAAAPWAMFHQLSSNPAPENSAPRTTAWKRSTPERWAPPDGAVPRRIESLLLIRDDAIPPARSSFSREKTPHPHPVASETMALQLAHMAYRQVDDCRRPVASAGGLDPIHLLTVGARSADGPRRVLHLSDDGDCHELCRLDLAEIRQALVPDPVIEGVIAAGASVILICVDPSNVIAKYGSRGWRYALIETGAVSHQIALQASLAGAHCRPVGGFVDERVEPWAAGLVPLLMTVVAVEATSPNAE